MFLFFPNKEIIIGQVSSYPITLLPLKYLWIPLKASLIKSKNMLKRSMK